MSPAMQLADSAAEATGKKDEQMKDRLSRNEIRKDAIEDGIEAAANTVGAVASIVTTAVVDVSKAIGGFATEVFAIADAARKAAADNRDD